MPAVTLIRTLQEEAARPITEILPGVQRSPNNRPTQVHKAQNKHTASQYHHGKRRTNGRGGQTVSTVTMHCPHARTLFDCLLLSTNGGPLVAIPAALSPWISVHPPCRTAGVAFSFYYLACCTNSSSSSKACSPGNNLPPISHVG